MSVIISTLEDTAQDITSELLLSTYTATAAGQTVAIQPRLSVLDGNAAVITLRLVHTTSGDSVLNNQIDISSQTKWAAADTTYGCRLLGPVVFGAIGEKLKVYALSSNGSDTNSSYSLDVINCISADALIGTPVALDSGTATVSGMLTKMADNAGGASFEASSDSLHEIAAGVEVIYNNIGDPVALDGGAATIGSMLTKMADDNDGGTFDATTDSLAELTTAVAAGFPINDHADVEPGGGTIVTGTNTANDSDSTWTNNDTFWQIASVSPAVGGFGLNVEQVFTLGTARKASQIQIYAKETFGGVGDASRVSVAAYNYITTSYDVLSDSTSAISGSTKSVFVYPLLREHQNEADGEVKIRYTTTNTNGQFLYLDQVIINSVALSEKTVAEIASGVWSHDISEHTDHTSAGFYASRSMVEHGNVVSITNNVVTCSGLQLLNDVYNGLTVEFHDETNNVYEVRKITDCAVNGGNLELTLDRIPYSTITSAWDAYVMPYALVSEVVEAVADIPTNAELATALTTTEMSAHLEMDYVWEIIRSNASTGETWKIRIDGVQGNALSYAASAIQVETDLNTNYGSDVFEVTLQVDETYRVVCTENVTLTTGDTTGDMSVGYYLIQSAGDCSGQHLIDTIAPKATTQDVSDYTDPLNTQSHFDDTMAAATVIFNTLALETSLEDVQTTVDTLSTSAELATAVVDVNANTDAAVAPLATTVGVTAQFAAIPAAIWDYLMSAASTAGSYGKWFKDYFGQ